MLSSAIVRSDCAQAIFAAELGLLQAGTLKPFSKVFAPASWFCPPLGNIGSLQFVIPGAIGVEFRFHPVNTRVNSLT